jgi:hypothetical protein
MVRVLLVIQVPDASDKGSVTLRFRPINCFFLSSESAKLDVRMVFDYIILNGRPFRAALGTSFYVNVRHSLLPGCSYRKICLPNRDRGKY